jgi:hypothetical protein
MPMLRYVPACLLLLPCSIGRAGAAAAAECPGVVASLSNLMCMSEHRVQQLIDKHPEVGMQLQHCHTLRCMQVPCVKQRVHASTACSSMHCQRI